MNSRKLSRRLVLRGAAGAAIGLPVLESITTSTAFAQMTAPSAKRFLCFFEHGGTICATTRTGAKMDGSGEYQGTDAWAPASPAEALQLGAIHSPLAPHVGSLLVLRGIDNKAGWDQAPYNGDHRWANASALTSATITKVGMDDIVSEGPSIDHVIATRLAMRNAVRFPSIDLEVPAHNYGTPFYTGPRQEKSRDYNPTTAFNRIFSGVMSGGSAPDPAVVRARALKKSVLDGTSTGLGVYKNQLSAADKRVIDEHLTHLRSIETRLDAVAIPMVVGCARPTVPTISGDWYGMNIQVTGPLMADIIVAALRCGLTNVATLEIGDFYARWLNPTYPAGYDIGHSLHHSANETGRAGAEYARWPQWYDTMLKNRQWRIGLLKRVLDGLAATPEGNGTMLDNSLMLWTSEFSLGAIHSVNDMPVLLAGKAGGRLRTGRHLNYNLRAATNPTTLQYQTRSSMHNLFVSILNAFDFPDTQFGTNHVWAHGPLTGLT
jgi:hypothetical protein